MTTIALTPVDALAAVRADIGDCTRCKLHTLGRQQVVFGVGNPEADLMFVGEAPGADEDIQGIPFVGRAGQLLTDIIEKGLKLQRSDVYIANVIKCRPPQNRNPEPDEIDTCEPFLFQQIDIIKPKVIVANDVSRADAGFEVDANAVTIVGADGVESIPLQSKSGVASAILNHIERLLTWTPTTSKNT